MPFRFAAYEHSPARQRRNQKRNRRWTQMNADEEIYVRVNLRSFAVPKRSEKERF
jgi:hypothetical protein